MPTSARIQKWEFRLTVILSWEITGQCRMIAAISGRSHQPTSMAKRCSATGLCTKWEECINSQELFRKKYLADVWPKALQRYVRALVICQLRSLAYCHCA